MRTNLIENRQIRVFISSTFQDMQDEREYLMRHTFPVLKQLAARRDVALNELDLRWGITEEEAETGKVVEICLREIENSIPFFVGIIGNRYGWVPEKKDIGLNVTERFPDVKDYIEKHLSVTDMEMQFGVLNRKEDMHAFFYIKEQEEAQDTPEMLNRLKDAVRASRYPDATYASPEDLGEQVKEAFIRLLDDIFPDQKLSEVEKEAGMQRAFRNSLCHNYIRDEHNFKSIDQWLEHSDIPQLVITGASGLGKSALIANWIKQKEETEGFPYRIVYHFVGNGGNEGSHGHIAHALVGAIQAAYGFEKDKSKNDTDELGDLFQKVASEGDQPLLVVLDAVNQIADEENAKQLNWLPIPPKNVRILFSTLEDDKTMDVFRNRKYPVFTLQPLNLDRRRQLVETYLSSYGKKLKDDQVTRIITDTQCENTLVLKTLLDELVNFGIFERLDERIDYFLRPNTMEQFYQTLLESYEMEFPFTEHVLSLIALSRSGLSEDELLKITKLSPLHWSQFYCSFNRHLTVSAGLITFAHTYIRKAVNMRYTLNEESEKTAVLREEIITLFCVASIFPQLATPRALHELPHQYYILHDEIHLYTILMDINTFIHLFCTDIYALVRYWIRLKEEGYSMEEYIPLAEVSEDSAIAFNYLSLFCSTSVVDLNLSLKFAEYSLRYVETEEGKAKILLTLGKSESLLGNHKNALKKCLEAFDVSQKYLGNRHPNTILSITNAGAELSFLGDYKKALEYGLKALKIAKESFGERTVYTAASFYRVGSAYGDLGDHQKALEYKQKALEIFREIFGDNRTETAMLFNSIGATYSHLGDHEKALEYTQSGLEVRHKIFGDIHPSTAQSYNNIGYIYSSQGNHQKALKYQLKALELYRKIFGERHSETATSFNSVGCTYYSLGNYEKALEYQCLALELKREYFGKNHPETAKQLGNVGATYGMLGDYDKELGYQKEALEILQKECGESHPDTITTLSNISITYNELGDQYYYMDNYEKALEYYLQALEIHRKIYGKNHSEETLLLSNIGLSYYLLCDYSMALEYYLQVSKTQQIFLGDNNAETAQSFDDVGSIYKELGDYKNALTFHLKALEIYKTLFGDSHENTALSYHEVASAYFDLADYGKALQYDQKALEIRQNILGELHIDTMMSYNNVGADYRELSDYENALQYISRARGIAKKMDDGEKVAFYTNRLALTYKTAGDIANAIAHYKQAEELYAQLGDEEEADENKNSAEELQVDLPSSSPHVPKFLKCIMDKFTWFS